MEKKAGWLKYTLVLPEATEEVQRHWFILKDDGLLVHSKKKLELDIYGEYINLSQFTSVDKSETDPEAFSLVSKTRKVTVNFGASKEDLDEWITSIREVIAVARKKVKKSKLDELTEDAAAATSDKDNLSGEEDGGSKEGEKSGGPNDATTPRKGGSSKIRKLLEPGGHSPDEIAATVTQDKTKGPRTVYSLVCKVSEAKNLKTGKGDSAFDAYCIVNLDHAKKRTRSIVKTVNPLWADEFTLEVLDPFSSKLRLSVWDEGKGSTSDTLIAKGDLQLNNLMTGTAVEEWYPLSYGRASAYVSGDLHVRLDRSNEKMGVVMLTVVEGRNLALTKSAHDFFVRIVYGKQTLKTKPFRILQEGRSQVFKKFSGSASNSLSDPEWNEIFEIAPESSQPDFCFTIHRKSPGNPCIGIATLRKKDYANERFIDTWLILEPEPQEIAKELDKAKSGDKHGEIRVTLKLNRAVVYSLEYYEPLLKSLLEDEGKDVINILEKITVLPEERNNTALNLVRIYEARNKAPSVLKSLISHEVKAAPDVETLFRANSLGSKAVDMYMKLVAYRYLQSVVMDTVNAVYASKKSAEIDPIKVDKGDDIKKNYKWLMKLLDGLLETIYDTVDECPTPLRGIFGHIQAEVVKKFPQDPAVRYTGVSGFLFLRFICAAILGPKLFDLKNDHPDAKAAKSLTIIAKTVQRIANMSPATPGMEGYLAELEIYIEKQQEKMKQFIDKISIPNEDLTVFDPAAVDLQLELSHLQEHLEKHLDDIVKIYQSSEVSNAAKRTQSEKLIQILDGLNENSVKENKRPPAMIKEGNIFVLNPKYLERMKARAEEAANASANDDILRGSKKGVQIKEDESDPNRKLQRKRSGSETEASDPTGKKRGNLKRRTSENRGQAHAQIEAVREANLAANSTAGTTTTTTTTESTTSSRTRSQTVGDAATASDSKIIIKDPGRPPSLNVTDLQVKAAEKLVANAVEEGGSATNNTKDNVAGTPGSGSSASLSAKDGQKSPRISDGLKSPSRSKSSKRDVKDPGSPASTHKHRRDKKGSSHRGRSDSGSDSPVGSPGGNGDEKSPGRVKVSDGSEKPASKHHRDKSSKSSGIPSSSESPQLPPKLSPDVIAAATANTGSTPPTTPTTQSNQQGGDLESSQDQEFDNRSRSRSPEPRDNTANSEESN